MIEGRHTLHSLVQHKQLHVRSSNPTNSHLHIPPYTHTYVINLRSAINPHTRQHTEPQPRVAPSIQDMGLLLSLEVPVRYVRSIDGKPTCSSAAPGKGGEEFSSSLVKVYPPPEPPCKPRG